MTDLTEYSYLWTSEKNQWQIKDLGDEDFLIFNKANNSALTIDDEELYEKLVKKMIEESVEVTKM